MSKVLALLALLLYYCTISQLEGGHYVRGASCTSFTKFTTAFFTNALLVNFKEVTMSKVLALLALLALLLHSLLLHS